MHALGSFRQVDDAALGVGGMAAKGPLVGHLLGREAGREGRGLVCDIRGSGPDGLPGLVSAGHFVGAVVRRLVGTAFGSAHE
jgi:hypothetical protein